ncbi:MAG: mannitol-1-phosphate 5-dehydrogenase, partial [Planctomycetes bacterium]|nr:mannitol-1-phosphate 5-dehydrogenase [Planctomycetota bacterium]
GADPRRKLSRTDRLIGPALLALKHGIKPRAIVEGVLAAVHFPDLDGQRLIDHFPGSDPHGLLTEVCELRSDEPLYEYIVTHWTRER